MAVAKAERLGSIEIGRAADNAAAKTAFGAAKAAIAGVAALNVPVWRVPALGKPFSDYAAPGGTAQVAGRTAGVALQQPAGVEGNVLISGWSAAYEDGAPATASAQIGPVPGQAAWQQITVTLPDVETKKVILRIAGRNLCGPTDITVELTPPAA